jgi:hypothetical protein
VEEVMYARALQKLQTELTIIGDGSFTRKSTDTDDSNASVVREVLSAIVSDKLCSSESDGFVVDLQGASLPHVDASFERTAGMFDIVADRSLDSLVARNADDISTFRRWQSHLEEFSGQAASGQPFEFPVPLESGVPCCSCRCNLDVFKSDGCTLAAAAPLSPVRLSAKALGAARPACRATRSQVEGSPHEPAVSSTSRLAQAVDLPDDLQTFLP